MPLTNYSIEPSSGFVERVVHHAVLVERRRRLRLNIMFSVLACGPLLARGVWNIFRHDYISVASLPWGHAISTAYAAAMSTTAVYALIAGGVVLAIAVVGLPRWRVAHA